MDGPTKLLLFRVQRDIPMPLVTSGVDHGNLRELALARMKDFGTECRDVRTREVGIQEIHNKVPVWFSSGGFGQEQLTRFLENN